MMFMLVLWLFWVVFSTTMFFLILMLEKEPFISAKGYFKENWGLAILLMIPLILTMGIMR